MVGCQLNPSEKSILSSLQQSPHFEQVLNEVLSNVYSPPILQAIRSKLTLEEISARNVIGPPLFFFHILAHELERRESTWLQDSPSDSRRHSMQAETPADHSPSISCEATSSCDPLKPQRNTLPSSPEPAAFSLSQLQFTSPAHEASFARYHCKLVVGLDFTLGLCTLTTVMVTCTDWFLHGPPLTVAAYCWLLTVFSLWGLATPFLPNWCLQYREQIQGGTRIVRILAAVLWSRLHLWNGVLTVPRSPSGVFLYYGSTQLLLLVPIAKLSLMGQVRLCRHIPLQLMLLAIEAIVILPPCCVADVLPGACHPAALLGRLTSQYLLPTIFLALFEGYARRLWVQRYMAGVVEGVCAQQGGYQYCQGNERGGRQSSQRKGGEAYAEAGPSASGCR